MERQQDFSSVRGEFCDFHQRLQPCSALGLLPKAWSCLQLEVPDAEDVSAKVGVENLVLYLCPDKATCARSSALGNCSCSSCLELLEVSSGISSCRGGSLHALLINMVKLESFHLTLSSFKGFVH